jgi:dolichyl-diphosphooligosaccharide---protein glycosyltransferase
MLATTVPVVRMTPLKSLEQMGPLLAFIAFQFLELTEVIRRKQKLSKFDAWKLRISVAVVCGLATVAVSYVLVQMGYFGPISARVRGLFVKHTKTGNPLVDSVAEHQAASPNAYFQYLDNICYLAPVGFGIVLLFKFHDSSSFLVVYAVAAYYFSQKMVRLILLTAPIAAVLGGIFLGNVVGWGISAALGERASFTVLAGTDEQEEEVKEESEPETKKKSSSKKGESPVARSVVPKDSLIIRLLRLLMMGYFLFRLRPFAKEFHEKCKELAKHLSHPTIIQKGRTQQGEDVTVDDYRQAYWWLRDNTPKDARIMAWWDYGYQIAGIANRTTIADGNTWNHEHIALLGKALTSPEKEGHRIARHLADYVLLWTGGGGDDLAKSPHMRRIANSVYRDLCPGDPTCQSFGVRSDGRPTPSMQASLLFTLHSHGVAGVEADKNRFRLVHQTKFGKVRIFKIQAVSQESKAWVADPANRICDAPGSWYCKGQYPPGLQKILKEKKDFKQLEDFNIEREDDSEYQRQYMENLNNPDKARRQAERSGESRKAAKLSKEEIVALNSKWEDTPITTGLWEAINGNDWETLKEMIMQAPQVAHMRSKDGRGPMWWAHEMGRKEIVILLKKLGVSEELQDEVGLTPLDVKKK